MSEAILFRYPYNLFLMERLEFLLLTQDELEARILRVLEYEMLNLKEKWQGRVTAAIEAGRQPPVEPKEYWVRLSHSHIITRLYRFDTARVGGAKQALSLSKTSLRRAISSLLKKELIFMRSVKGDEFGAPQYTLNREAIQQLFDAFPKEVDPYTIFYRTPLSLTEVEEVPNWKVGSFHFSQDYIPNWLEGVSKSERGEMSNRKVFKEGDQESDQKDSKVAEEKGAPAELQNGEGASAAAHPFLTSLSEEEIAFFGSLSEEEIALILSLRQKQAARQEAAENGNPGPSTQAETAPVASGAGTSPASALTADQQPPAASPASKPDQASATEHGAKAVLPASETTPSQPADPPVEELARPASAAPVTDGVIVQLWEYLRQVHYSEAERKGQLAAAQELLHLPVPLPLSVDLLEQVYRRFFDEFWQRKFNGVMNVSHLVQTEQSTGQIRIVRWLTLMQKSQGSGPAAAPAPTTPSSAAHGVNYADLMGMSDHARQELVDAQRARADQQYAELGIDRETLMAMEPEARIAFVKQRRAERQALTAAATSAG